MFGWCVAPKSSRLNSREPASVKESIPDPRIMIRILLDVEEITGTLTT